jgi:two-component system, OmpR family, heavy metal sensor histidine kinase CusS
MRAETAMRSIRISLLVYFLGLVTLAVGATSLLAYRSTRQTLQDKEVAIAGLIQAKHEKRRLKEQARFDDELLSKANGLALRAGVEIQISKLMWRELHFTGVFQAQALPNAFATLPSWLGFGVRAKFVEEIYRAHASEIHLPKSNSDLILPAETGAGEYFQIDSNYRGIPLRSKSLGATAFPNVQGFGAEDIVRSQIDDVELTAGQMVRRIRLKNVSSRVITAWPWGFGLPPRPPTDPVVGPPTPRSGNPTPNRPPNSPPNGGGRRNRRPNLVIYVQYAIEPKVLDKTLADLRDARDEELAALSEQTGIALARQRNQLLAISTVTFIATILGAYWLVWVGLSPLRRLTEAVSRVSAKDFRLPLGDAPMPAELQPIVDRLSETLGQLKRAFAREKQSTADISHELRTPLAAVLTTLELALRKPRTTDKYREMIQDCQASALHMNQIIERLLTLARLDAGVDRLKPQTIDVRELAQQCAGVVRPLAESQGLSLACPAPTSTGEGAAQVHTDPDKLREVINNLLHNAVQYNRPDGTIELTVERESSHVQVRIRDTGIGIAPEVQNRIFERFFRADPSRSGDGMNAGLGLAIAKEYVELMGGRISVESVVGQGSTFRVRLPIQPVVTAA